MFRIIWSKYKKVSKLGLSLNSKLLKKAATLTFSYICQHTGQLVQSLSEYGLEKIAFLNYNDTQLKKIFNSWEI